METGSRKAPLSFGIDFDSLKKKISRKPLSGAIQVSSPSPCRNVDSCVLFPLRSLAALVGQLAQPVRGEEGDFPASDFD